MAKANAKNIADKYAAGIPNLHEELLRKSGEVLEKPDFDLAKIPLGRFPSFDATTIGAMEGDTSLDKVREEHEERVVALRIGARPVMRILNNQVTKEFIGPDSESWAAAIMQVKDALNLRLPAVGRIELKNSDYPWVGTGWLIDTDVIVTNKHVAVDFARGGSSESGFIFRPGLISGTVSAAIDFLEEDNRSESLEYSVASVLWIAGPGEADVAFLRITRGANQDPLPPPIPIADKVDAEQSIVAVGYPGRDDSIADQKMVFDIFGDVYEKKRLAPGKVKTVSETLLEHDCSTTGGNSGCVLLNFKGEAVGLHRGGYIDDSANTAVPAKQVYELLNRALRSVGVKTELVNKSSEVAITAPQTNVMQLGSSFTLTMNIPIEITVKVGAAVPVGTPAARMSPPETADLTTVAATLEEAVQAARTTYKDNPDVLDVRSGYRFKNGWITDEPVIVIKIAAKMDYVQLTNSGKSPFPPRIRGFGVDVRTAPLPDQLERIGVDLTILERRSRRAGYREPPGFDDLRSDIALKGINEKMRAIFHVSPDSGFPNLKEFFERVTNTLTATMYEWEPNHISDAIEAAISPDGRKLKMVTQKRGVAEKDATESAVDDMKQRLGDKFEHIYASVRGPRRLIQNSYHIKVASRDDEEFWLSSGNWKESNQADINPAETRSTDGRPLRQHNREWHAIIRHAGLAKLFRKYIDFDFDQAKLFPLEEAEAVRFPDLEFFVPVEVFDLPEARRVLYREPLVIEEADGPLEIQPLLTPDRNGRGEYVFLTAATQMIQRATTSIFLQNQSFSMTESDNDELVGFFTALRDKQQQISDVRIIMRDARDYHRAADIEKQEELIERLKRFGFDTSSDHLRIQSKCHTKGLIIDSSEVILGSQNLTNMGALFNRDASLLVRSQKVAQYFSEIFEFDWDNLTHNDVDERVGGIRIAQPGEPTPPNFRRVPLAELLGED